MVTSRARCRRAAPYSSFCRLLGCVVALASFAGLACLTFGSLQVRGDRFGLGAAAARTAAALLVATITRGLGATLRAVRHRAFLPFLGLFANRSRETRLGNRVGNGLGDELDGTDRVVIAGDRHGDEVGICVGVDDRDDRD